MARIIGTIESLKQIKSELTKRGISRFNSVKEINDFLSNYDSEKHAIFNETSEILNTQYAETCINLKQRIETKTQAIKSETEKIEKRKSDWQTKVDVFDNNKNLTLFKKFILGIDIFITKQRLSRFEKNKMNRLNVSLRIISNKINSDERFIKEYETNRQNLIAQSAKSKMKNLEYTRDVVENLKNKIAGAIGENLVVKEIEKLSDDYILINDFNLGFSPPIYYKRNKERIYSIQIDHLLISRAGIFILETKNWSKTSVNSFDLRSPITQIVRSNFALYVYLSENISLNEHHWGEQKIPIRNVIVMINNRPRGNFKYVQVKLLQELNDYIRYFEPCLTERQFNRIVSRLT